MTKAVVFDVGGVLAHDVWEHLLLDEPNGVAAKYKLDRAAVERVGELLWEVFAYRPEEKQKDWQALERQYWRGFIRYFGDQLPPTVSPEDFIQMTADFIKPVDMETMSRLLEEIQSRSLDLAICSNNTEFWIRRQMDQLSLHKFFSPRKIILSCRVGVSKSSPRYEMFHAVTEALGVLKSQCVFVDDKKRNVNRAQECGMIGIHFTNSQNLEKSLVTTLQAQ